MKLKQSKRAPPEKVEATIRSLFDSATRSLWISTGLSTRLVDDLKEPFLAALNRVDDARVLLDAHVNVNEAAAMFPWLFSEGRWMIRQSGVPITHWIVADGRDFRMEQAHSPGAERRNNLTIKDCDPLIANVLLERFLTMWSDANPVERLGHNSRATVA